MWPFYTEWGHAVCTPGVEAPGCWSDAATAAASMTKGGQGGKADGVQGPSPQWSRRMGKKRKNLISSDKKPNGLWKMPGLYSSLWKQDLSPRSWYQEEAKTHLSLRSKTWLPARPCRCVHLGICPMKHAGKKKQAPIVCQVFNLEISTIFWFSVVSVWYSKPTSPSGEYADPELAPQCTFFWCFSTAKPQTLSAV